MSPILSARGGLSSRAYGQFAASTAAAPDTGAMFPLGMVQVGSGGAADVTFSSIPSTYKHLQVRALMRNTRTSDRVGSPFMRFNSDTGTNYYYHRLYGDGSAAGADAPGSASTSIVGLGVATDLNTAGIFGVGVWDILDYANTNKYKTTRLLSGIDNNRTTDAGYASISSGVWNNTNAITSVTLLPNVNIWSEGSTFALYGIKGA